MIWQDAAVSQSAQSPTKPKVLLGRHVAKVIQIHNCHVNHRRPNLRAVHTLQKDTLKRHHLVAGVSGALCHALAHFAVMVLNAEERLSTGAGEWNAGQPVIPGDGERELVPGL
jgi:hypothetical protein